MLVGAVVVALIGLGAVLVHVTGGTRNAWLHVLYVPVLVAAFRFGVRGAVVAAVLSGLAVGPAMPLDTASGLAQQPLNWVFRTLLFVVVATVAGATHEVARRRHVALVATTSRFRSLVRNASDLILVVGADGTVTYASPSIRHLLGRTPASVRDQPLRSLLHPGDAGAALDLARGASRPVEARMRHTDGSWRHLSLVATDLRADPAVGGVVVNGHDVTERRAVEAELRYNATHDPLTGLANRTLTRHHLAEVLDRSASGAGGPATLLLLRLDRLQGVNEAYGHAAGDRVLAALATRLQQHLAPDDLLGRFSGSELAVVSASRAGGRDAKAFAARLLRAAREPFTLGDDEVFLNASVGVATQRPEHDGDALIADAYVALQEAVQRPGAHSVVFAPHLRERRSAVIKTDSALHRALRGEELRVHMQPIVHAGSGRVVGVEALVRWQHPSLGLLPPVEFIPVAEETGLIRPIGAWVLERACAWLGNWRRREPAASALRLSVNMSAQQLADPELPAIVERALAGAAVPPDRLTVEITESSVIGGDAGRTVARLRRLRSLGVHVAMDDFGTGYSSLGVLGELPVDVLKIDRSFVRRLGSSRQDDEAIVSAVVGLARSLDLRTVAEGVETHEQRQLLLALGCELQQGFLFGRPQPADELDVASMLASPAVPARV